MVRNATGFTFEQFLTIKAFSGPVMVLPAMLRQRYQYVAPGIHIMSFSDWLNIFPRGKHPIHSHSDLFQRHTVSALNNVSEDPRNSWKSGNLFMSVFLVFRSEYPRLQDSMSTFLDLVALGQYR